MLQAEIRQLKQVRQSPYPVSEEIMSGGHLLGKSRLESLLDVEYQYVRLVSCHSCSYKVKINEYDVAAAFSNSRKNGSFVAS